MKTTPTKSIHLILQIADESGYSVEFAIHENTAIRVTGEPFGKDLRFAGLLAKLCFDYAHGKDTVSTRANDAAESEIAL